MRFVRAALSALLFLSPLSSFAETELRAQLRKEVTQHTGKDFGPLLKKWQTTSSHEKTRDALMSLARDPSLPDPSRYIALQGFAHLSASPPSHAPASKIKPLSTDPSWMMRTASLKALEKVSAPEAATLAVTLLKDPALVVRMEALSSIEKLKLSGKEIEHSLLDAAEDPRNWKENQPLVIPERAVNLVMRLRNKNGTPQTELRRAIASLRSE
jgi:HEAT repeat protein